MARSKGLTDRRILWRHALRPSSISLLASAGVTIGGLITGLFIVELLLQLPGLGYQLISSVNQDDYRWSRASRCSWPSLSCWSTSSSTSFHHRRPEDRPCVSVIDRRPTEIKQEIARGGSRPDAGRSWRVLLDLRRLLVILALWRTFASLLPLPNPNLGDFDSGRTAARAGATCSAPTIVRDILSRLIYGARVSLRGRLRRRAARPRPGRHPGHDLRLPAGPGRHRAEHRLLRLPGLPRHRGRDRHRVLLGSLDLTIILIVGIFAAPSSSGSCGRPRCRTRRVISCWRPRPTAPSRPAS